MPGAVDSPHALFLGRGPELVHDVPDVNEAARLEWRPLAEVPALIASGDVTNAATVIALLMLRPDAR